jgi:hypothetical protein
MSLFSDHDCNRDGQFVNYFKNANNGVNLNPGQVLSESLPIVGGVLTAFVENLDLAEPSRVRVLLGPEGGEIEEMNDVRRSGGAVSRRSGRRSSQDLDHPGRLEARERREAGSQRGYWRFLGRFVNDRVAAAHHQHVAPSGAVSGGPSWNPRALRHAVLAACTTAHQSRAQGRARGTHLARNDQRARAPARLRGGAHGICPRGLCLAEGRGRIRVIPSTTRAKTPLMVLIVLKKRRSYSSGVEL